MMRGWLRVVYSAGRCRRSVHGAAADIPTPPLPTLPSSLASKEEPQPLPSTVGAFHYVIVGAGTAGCVLANRLSADPRNSVLLLEAGPSDWFPLIHVPIGYLYTMNNPQTCWCFSTSEQPGLGQRTIAYPRGKVLGGSSSINGMIYQRGQKEDYDGWAETCGPDWSWDAVQPLFGS